MLASESKQLLTATLESPRVDSECPKHAKSLPVIISFLPLSHSLPATSKNTAAEEFAAANLSGLVGFLHLIAPTSVLCACLTECSSSVLSKITFIHPTQALVCQRCQHTRLRIQLSHQWPRLRGVQGLRALLRQVETPAHSRVSAGVSVGSVYRRVNSN